MMETAAVVICGAGIAGTAAAYALAVGHGMKNVALVDERPPLTLTSDKSSECYRNWWPSQVMVRFMNRSIDLLEKLADESDNYFHLNRRGYVYVAASRETAVSLQQSAAHIATLGAGDLRIHDGRGTLYQPADPHAYRQQPTGADLLLGSDLIRAHFPFVTPEATAVLHVRRAGWLSAQQLGMYLWQQAREHGARLVNGRVTHVSQTNGAVSGVRVAAAGQTIHLSTGRFVNAAGPFLRQVGQMVGVELPITNELHGKIALEDPLGIIPRDAPMMIYNDAVTPPWSDDERAYLAEQAETRHLLGALPPGAHFRPEGGPGSQTLLMLWPYHTAVQDTPRWPLQFDPEYPDVALRGLACLAPGLAAYFERRGKPVIDGGHYTRTVENRPLIGPLPLAGAYVVGALSGYGIMAAPAAGELLAAHITDDSLPDYAPAFLPSRYEDPAYQAQAARWAAEDGQL
ncbi:MAG: FAD-binding oxidoreductase [Chloroflexi bacterium]|nr:FAD-binding oxidoreductase [Chloroflexota bacterium]